MYRFRPTVYDERFFAFFRDFEPDPYRRAFAALEGSPDPDAIAR